MMTTVLISACFLVGFFLAWRHRVKCYDRGITDAVLMHKSGRLTYTTYLDVNGAKRVSIEIEPIDD